jgi:hypothetical protein
MKMPLAALVLSTHLLVADEHIVEYMRLNYSNLHQFTDQMVHVKDMQAPKGYRYAEARLQEYACPAGKCTDIIYVIDRKIKNELLHEYYLDKNADGTLDVVASQSCKAHPRLLSDYEAIPAATTSPSVKHQQLFDELQNRLLQLAQDWSLE